MPALCLGEALVDLVCERPVSGLAEADQFVPHFGGATANVAVTAARRGGRVALAGGAGDDAWGRWLRDRLEREGVETRWFELAAGRSTPVAFVAVDASGEPEYAIYGEGIGQAIAAFGEHVDEAVEACDGLFFGSNTLASEAEEAVTMRALERARALERPVLFDPNVRLHRWKTAAAAAAACNRCVPGALLVRCNRAEAELMTGERDPDAAARALVKMGARLAVVTLGAGGAILRGELKADVPGVRANVRSTVGAGDVLMGTLLAALQRTGYYPAAVAATLGDAVAESARATERWSALG